MKNNLETYLTTNSHLTQNERSIILANFQELSLKKNEYWVKLGDVSSHIAFVESGILRIVGEINEEVSTMQFVLHNSFTTSLTSLVYQTPSIWGIQALTDCKLQVISRDSHFKLVSEFKNWLELDNVQLLKAYTELENSAFSQFHLNAEQRFKKLFFEKPEIFNQVPLKFIASSLGIKPETLSRLRKRHLQ